MKTPFVGLTLATALLAAPSHAASQSELTDAILSAYSETSAAFGPRPNLAQALGTLPLRYSADTAEKLTKVFGNAQPLRVKPAPAPKGQVGYLMTLQPLRFSERGRVEVEWSELAVKLALNKAGNTLATDGRWAGFAAGDRYSSVRYSDIRFNSQHERNADGVWFGATQGRIGVIAFDETPLTAPAKPRAPSKNSKAFRMEDVRFSTGLGSRGKVADLSYRLSAATLEVNKEKIERLNLSLRLTNIDAKVVKELSQSLNGSVAAALNNAHSGATLQQFEQLGKRALLNGAALAIDDLSGSFRGDTAALKGHIGLANATEDDLDSFSRMLGKLVARFELRMPISLVRNVAVIFTRAGSEAERLSLGRKAADKAIDKAIGDGYVRLDDGELYSTIEYKDGKLSANAKALDMSNLLGGPPRRTR
ncbi:DUF945 family protein [Janthinobacterium fluminis]|uniref:DUF945 family protein n=1 Tax=Janthinobacterium fluminis TaxID=2987524 RepID=A0ABT5K3X6_9BURK|nr:DUF945 family protein [Janthinobacterium fluminis]MDC8759175.1 DUF945 family protein [Janthinobacterium fluminis]